MDSVELAELRQVMIVLRSIVQEMGIATSALEKSLSDTNVQKDAINELDIQLIEIEKYESLLEPDDFAGLEEDDAAITSLYERKHHNYTENLKTLKFHNWKQYVRDSQSYCLAQGIDTTLPWEAMLTEEDLAAIKTESYEAQYRWDKWDYMFVGTAGVLAALSDFLLVRLPCDMSGISKYAGQKGSPITAWMKGFNTEDGEGWVANWVRDLKNECKVPYDAKTAVLGEGITNISGMGGLTHRFQSLGHDPVLGFVFGVFDIMRGSMTGFSYDKLTGMHSPFHGQVWSSLEPIGLIEAIIIQFKHLITDVATPMGLPAPFMGLLQAINVPVPGSSKGRTVAEVARWMYTQGYDFRHFLVMGITPAVIEITLRLYIMLRHYSEHGETKIFLANDPKYRSMLLSAHSIACAGNAGKIALMQGNPLAINYTEWLALLRYLVPSAKYWLFDRTRLKLEHLHQINEQGWEELCQSSDELLLRIHANNMPVIKLGECS